MASLEGDIGPHQSPNNGNYVQTDAKSLTSLIPGYKKKTYVAKQRDDESKRSSTCGSGFPRYRMDSPNSRKRGFAVIINNENFHWTTGMNQRKGTDADQRNLEKMFKNMDFDVQVHKDVTVDMIIKITKEMASRDHTDFDCFVMAFLSHGDDGVLWATNGTVDINTMVDNFRGDQCPGLAGKPKIFIFQACRGMKHEIPVSPCEDFVDGSHEDLTSLENDVVVDHAVRPTIPSGSDFLFCYSVAQGFYSHRDTLYGSWYIQALVEIFEEELFHKGVESQQEVDILDLLTLVNHRVSLRRVERTRNPESYGKKQMPCFLSMLTKKLYFKQK